jgi:hypothetical protein
VYILRLCERFKCLPSVLLAEDSDLLRMLAIEELVTAQEV